MSKTSTAPTPVSRSFVGLAGATEIRTNMFKGKPHLVVPVIALVGDSVVRGVKAKVSEFVPAQELAKSPGGWNGRPVIADHPESGNGSANEPRVLEELAFGQMFNTRFESGKLKTEAWIDAEQAQQLGGEALSVVERLNAGETIEVSVGVWVTPIPRQGSHGGEDYQAVWSDLMPDHLAMLPAGVTGACSVDAGCGAPRMNQQQKGTDMNKPKDNTADSGNATTPAVSSSAIEPTDPTQGPAASLGFVGRILQKLSAVFSLGSATDVELRDALERALREVVPGYDGIHSVIPDDGVVFYTTWLDNQITFFKQKFNFDGDSLEAALKGAAVEVVPTTEFKPASAAEQSPPTKTTTNAAGVAAGTASSACSCNNRGEPNTMKETTKQLVERLVAHQALPFADADVAALEGFGDERLEEILTEADKHKVPIADPPPESNPDPKKLDTAASSSDGKDPDPPVAEEKTEAQWMEEAPVALREMVGRYQSEEKQRRSDLVTALSEAQEAYSKEQLEAKDTPDLMALSEALKIAEPVRDFSGKGSAGDSEINYEPPLPYGDLSKPAN